MSYAGMLDKNLVKAFKLIKDLAVTAVFVKKVSTSFDFETGTVITTDSGTTSAKVVIIDSTKAAKDRNTQQLQIMFKAEDVGDLVLYETVTIDGVSWKFGKHIKSDRFISVIELFREK